MADSPPTAQAAHGAGFWLEALKRSVPGDTVQAILEARASGHVDALAALLPRISKAPNATVEAFLGLFGQNDTMHVVHRAAGEPEYALSIFGSPAVAGKLLAEASGLEALSDRATILRILKAACKEDNADVIRNLRPAYAAHLLDKSPGEKSPTKGADFYMELLKSVHGQTRGAGIVRGQAYGALLYSLMDLLKARPSSMDRPAPDGIGRVQPLSGGDGSRTEAAAMPARALSAPANAPSSLPAATPQSPKQRGMEPGG